jgi:hypothetical protein
VALTEIETRSLPTLTRCFPSQLYLLCPFPIHSIAGLVAAAEPADALLGTPKVLTHSLPLISTCRFAHLCRSRPRGSVREQTDAVIVKLAIAALAAVAFLTVIHGAILAAVFARRLICRKPNRANHRREN